MFQDSVVINIGDILESDTGVSLADLGIVLLLFEGRKLYELVYQYHIYVLLTDFMY